MGWGGIRAGMSDVGSHATTSLIMNILHKIILKILITS